MTAGKMHENEVPTDVDLVRRLLSAQLPQWAGLPLAPVPSAGTDHSLYRLGDDKVVRLPRIEWALGQAAKESEWLPRLAPQLPLEIPVPLAQGSAGEGYPWHWSVYPWLAGENATPERLADLVEAAHDLAAFVVALQRIEADGPPAGAHNVFRGVPLRVRDAHTRAAIEASRGLLDAEAATAAWESALRAPEWDRPPVWIHGDLQSGNLLARSGQIGAVIDFGLLGVGDPACELIVAWNLFSGESRAAFRAALGVDEATWARGRGWALSVGLVALPYYLETNPGMVAMSRLMIDEVLADFARG